MTNNRWPKTLLANIAEVSFYIGINTSFHLPSVSDSTVHYYILFFILWYGCGTGRARKLLGRHTHTHNIISFSIVIACHSLPLSSSSTFLTNPRISQQRINNGRIRTTNYPAHGSRRNVSSLVYLHTGCCHLPTLSHANVVFVSRMPAFSTRLEHLQTTNYLSETQPFRAPILQTQRHYQAIHGI